MMATDLTKMVEDWHSSSIRLYRILLAMAAEIEANREEIEKLKHPDVNPYLLNEEEIEQFRDFMGKR